MHQPIATAALASVAHRARFVSTDSFVGARRRCKTMSGHRLLQIGTTVSSSMTLAGREGGAAMRRDHFHQSDGSSLAPRRGEHEPDGFNRPAFFYLVEQPVNWCSAIFKRFVFDG